MKHWMPALVVALLIFWLSSSSNPPGQNLAPDYVGHFVLYGVFALTLLWALTRGLQKKITAKRAVGAFFFSSLYSATDEFHQSFVPHRSPSWSDILADVLGAASFLLVTLALVWIYRRRRQVNES